MPFLVDEWQTRQKYRVYTKEADSLLAFNIFSYDIFLKNDHVWFEFKLVSGCHDYDYTTRIHESWRKAGDPGL